MLKNRLLSGVAAVAMFAAASGATPAAARETFEWTGVYIGGHVGYGEADYGGGKTLVEASPIFVADFDLDGFAGGGHVGVNDRFGSPLGEGHDFVVAIEGDATLTDWNATLLADVGDSTEAISGDVDVLASVRARLGVMYERGYGVPQDNDEAVKWDRLAQLGGFGGFGGSGSSGMSGFPLTSDKDTDPHMALNIDCALTRINVPRSGGSPSERMGFESTTLTQLQIAAGESKAAAVAPRLKKVKQDSMRGFDRGGDILEPMPKVAAVPVPKGESPPIFKIPLLGCKKLQELQKSKDAIEADYRGVWAGVENAMGFEAGTMKELNLNEVPAEWREKVKERFRGIQKELKDVKRDKEEVIKDYKPTTHNEDIKTLKNYSFDTSVKYE